MIRNLPLALAGFLLILGFIFPHTPVLGNGGPLARNSTAPKIPERQRYLTIVIFGYETDPRIDDERIENAGRMGCNSAEISVHWDQVYNTRNSAANWRVVDSHVNTALRMGMKVALRIHTAREPRFVNGFWGTEESMQAGDGTRMHFGGAVQFSFAHQPTLELVKNFVREVTQRYQYLQQQDHLLFMSTVASPIQEAEYSPRNGRGDTTYPIPFDYSEPMRQGFRQWLQGRFSLDALNRRWGSDFSRWESVSPPPYNQMDPYISFSRGRWGEDWYVFRHLMLKRFIDETNRTIKEVNGAIQVVNQHGCVWDRQSGLRSTFAFRNLAQNSDGVKINDGPDYNFRYSMDVVRSNVRPGAWICNEVDGMYYQNTSVDRFYQQVAESFEHGARMVTLANFGAWDARGPLNQLIQKVVNQGLLSQPVTQVQPASNTSYKLSSMVRDDVTDSEGRAGDQWSRSYNQNGRRPVNIVINEDWLEDNANQDPRVRQPIPNQTAYSGKPFEFSIPPATFEDPDGSITKIEITGGLPAMGLSANGVTISGTPNSTGTITVTVRAIDNKNSPVSTQFQINVLGENANQAPVVNQPIQDRTAIVGQEYAFRIPDETFKDPDGRIVSIQATDLPAGLGYDAGTYTISGKPTAEGVSTISLKATDDKGTSVTTTFKLTITRQDEVNKPPVVSKVIPAQTATVGQNFSYTIPNETFSDPDGQIAILDVSGLTNGLYYEADSRTIKGSPTIAGTITVKVKATDNKGASVTTELRLTINPSTSAEQLAILEPTVDCGTGEIKFRTSGGDGTKIDFRAVGIVEDWTPSSAFTIPPWLRNGVTFEIQARQSGKEIKFTYTTPCKGYEPPIVAKPMSDQTYPIGQFFILRIPAETFQASTPIEVAVSALPAGLAYDKRTWAISGTPTQAGATTITVTATDERGAKAEDTFILTIQGRTETSLTIVAPTINCQTGRLTIRTEGGNGSPLTYSIPGVGDWNSNPTFSISLDKLNGTELRLLARQGDREVSYTYKTNCTAPGSSTLADQTITIGQAYSYELPNPGPGVTYNVSGMPEGLTYNPANRTISGIPVRAGSATLIIKGVDDKGNEIGQLAFTLIVVNQSPVSGNLEGFLDLVNCTNIAGWVWDQSRPNTPLTVEFLVGSTLESARVMGSTEANIFRQDLRDNGKGNGSHGYRWDTAEELKNNQTYSVWGRVQGTSYLLKGSPKTLTCNGTNTPTKPADPTVNQPPVGPTLSSLSATANVAYLTILPVFTDPEGGALTYTLSGQPTGLAFDRVSRGLSGTVTTAGSYKLTYTATDNQGAKTSIDIALTVSGDSNPTTPTNPTNPTTPVSGNYEGFLDLVSCGSISGWVWDQSRPNTPLTVEFLVGSTLESARLVGSTEANIFRQDLRDGGKGNGSHGYRWDTAEELKNNQTYSVWGRVLGTSYLLKGSPKTLTCNGTGTTPTTPTTPPTNQPPVGPTLSSLSATANVAYLTILPVFTDPEGGALTYTLSGQPAGLLFDAATRGLSGVTTAAGSHKLTYTATDNQGAKTSIDIALTVSGGSNPTTPTNPTNPTTPVSGNYEGFLDLVSCGSISGWVWDQSRPNTPLTVEFLVGSTLESARLVGSTEANIFRQDLRDGGKGNGSHGYRWDTAEELKNNQTYSVWGRVLGTSYLLKGSPKTLTCNGTGTTPTTPTTPTTNQPPVGPTLSSLSATANVAYVTVLPVFTDPEGGILTYSLSGQPAGLLFDAATRGLSGVTTAVGSHKLTYTATDNQGAKTSVDIALTVNPAPTTPTTPTGLPLTVLAPDFDCQTGRITFRTSGGDNTQIEFKAAGLTDWTTSATHTIPLTMRKGSTFEIEVRQSQKVVKYSFTTTCDNGKAPINDQIITKGLFHTFTLPDPGSGVQMDVSGLPDGISYNAANRTASGKPQNAGEFIVTVKSTIPGQASSSITFKLTVREPQLTVQLMKAGNAASRQIIQELTNNSFIGISNLPDRVNFFCTSNVPVGSIAFELTGASSNNYVDNQAPFGLFGDDDGFRPLTGSYVLRLAAFTGANGSGETIITKNIAFSFVQSGGRIGVTAETVETTGGEWIVYPNPVREVINLTVPGSNPEKVPYKFSLTSTSGGQWELPDNTVESNQRKVMIDIKTLQLPTGLYFLQIQNGEGVQKVIKVLKQ